MLDNKKHPVSDCHEMVQDSNGRIILLTNNTKNNVIIYDKGGNLIDTWGTDYPGAHGLTIKNEGGEDYLYITDTERHEVVKTTLDGRIILSIEAPDGMGTSENPDQFNPTETAIAENGDIYVADGYGSQNIFVFDQKGRIKNTFGGKGDGIDQFHNAHGIAIDTRSGNPRLLITARSKNQLKYFSMAGEYESTIDLPGAYICRPVIKDENVYLATIWSGRGLPNTGFISILDKDNKLLSCPGGNYPNYKKGELSELYQTLEIFKHPHDVCIDNDDNLYIPQWNAGQVYPIKLTRV